MPKLSQDQKLTELCKIFIWSSSCLVKKKSQNLERSVKIALSHCVYATHAIYRYEWKTESRRKQGGILKEQSSMLNREEQPRARKRKCLRGMPIIPNPTPARVRAAREAGKCGKIALLCIFNTRYNRLLPRNALSETRRQRAAKRERTWPFVNPTSNMSQGSHLRTMRVYRSPRVDDIFFRKLEKQFRQDRPWYRRARTCSGGPEFFVIKMPMRWGESAELEIQENFLVFISKLFKFLN